MHAFVEAVGDRPLLEVAHVVGDGLVLAVHERVAGAGGLAAALAEQLNRARVPGDQELAAELNAARGVAPATAVQPLAVDLDDVATHLESQGLGDEGWRIDVTTGQWWPEDPEATIGEQAPDYWNDDDRWLRVEPLGSQFARWVAGHGRLH